MDDLELEDHPWVRIDFRRHKYVSPLLHIKDTNLDLGEYASGALRMRTLCGVESSNRKPVENIHGCRLCDACLRAVGLF
jgi:hypothetical protein